MDVELRVLTTEDEFSPWLSWRIRVTRTLMYPLSNCRFFIILASFLLVLSTGIPERSVAEPIQSKSDFKNAFRKQGQISTSYPLVLITVVDDRTHQSRTGCTGANFLVGALILEHLGGSSKTNSDNVGKTQKAQQIALANTSHIFHFSNQAALDNVPFGYDAACDAIKRGMWAVIPDIGDVQIGGTPEQLARLPQKPQQSFTPNAVLRRDYQSLADCTFPKGTRIIDLGHDDLSPKSSRFESVVIDPDTCPHKPGVTITATVPQEAIEAIH